MATTREIESAAAAGRKPTRPGSTFNDATGPLLATPRGSEDAEQRERTRAARALIRLARSPADADLLLEICGLTHSDAMPEPNPARAARLKAMTTAELIADLKTRRVIA